MNKYLFIGERKNTSSSSYMEQLKFVNCNQGEHRYYFTIYDQDHVIQYPLSQTTMIDDVSGEFTTNARIKYRIIFHNYKDSYGNKVHGKKMTNSLAKFGVEPSYKEGYKLSNGWCGAALFINEDNTAQFEIYGSGIHYQIVVKGRVVSVV